MFYTVHFVRSEPLTNRSAYDCYTVDVAPSSHASIFALGRHAVMQAHNNPPEKRIFIRADVVFGADKQTWVWHPEVGPLLWESNCGGTILSANLER